MRTPVALFAGLALLSTVQTAASAAPFEITRYGGEGRVVAADLGDFDGDGRTDLLVVTYVGLPPDEKRIVRVYRQGEDGRIDDEADVTAGLPRGSASYDLADVAHTPGTEMVLLTSTGFTVLSLASKETKRFELRAGDATTVGAGADERGLKRLRLAWSGFGEEIWLLLPQFGVTVALSPTGEVRARLNVGGRANYLILPQPGPLFVESDMQLYFDVPRFAVGDVDGDGRNDFVASTRHEIRVFLRRPDGSFAFEPDRTLDLGRVDAKDHVRGSGTVRVDAKDFDGDGRLDLLVSQLKGGLTDGKAETSAYRNRDGHWNLDRPDKVFSMTDHWGGDELIDLDGDGRLELIRIRVPMSVMELIEALVTSEFDAKILVHRVDETGQFGTAPTVNIKLDIPFSFGTGRPEGFTPNVQYDLNGDGIRDLVVAGDGDELGVYLGGDGARYRRLNARQKLDTRGRLRGGDIDGDGLVDLLIYDPFDLDSKVRLLRNRGTLRK